jgi:hypothetical protein
MVSSSALKRLVAQCTHPQISSGETGAMQLLQVAAASAPMTKMAQHGTTKVAPIPSLLDLVLAVRCSAGVPGGPIWGRSGLPSDP